MDIFIRIKRLVIARRVLFTEKAELEMTYSMSLSHPKEAPISEHLPCPECSKVQMTRTVETWRLGDGLAVKRLRHYKCRSCGARFFDDDAMHCIQSIRASRAASKSVR